MTRLWHLDRIDGARRGRELLERFDLMDARGRPVKTYSGGMRRRLDLALSLVSRPKLLFLDEPTTGLDPRSRVTLWESVKELASAGVTVFLTTQYLEEADTLADRVAILDGGRIIAEGTPEQLKLRIGGETATLVFPNLHHLVRATAKLGERARPLTSEGDALSVSTSGDADDLRRLLNELSEEDIRVAKLTLREPTLDDVFFTLTGRPAQPQEAA
jgi:ABC-2 type transport system ATP-binding protein